MYILLQYSYIPYCRIDKIEVKYKKKKKKMKNEIKSFSSLFFRFFIFFTKKTTHTLAQIHNVQLCDSKINRISNTKVEYIVIDKKLNKIFTFVREPKCTMFQ